MEEYVNTDILIAIQICWIDGHTGTFHIFPDSALAEQGIITVPTVSDRLTTEIVWHLPYFYNDMQKLKYFFFLISFTAKYMTILKNLYE